MDYNSLAALRQHHSAWRLLASSHAPLIISFLHTAFIEHNRRVVDEADLIEALEDLLFHLRAETGDSAFPKSASQYLADWAAPEKGWLRRFYKQQSDEVQFDLTPATEKAISWLKGLMEREFVGTESRLLTLFELLRQLVEGSDENPESRLQELYNRRAEIDAEIARVERGDIALLSETAQKDRFMQFSQQAEELLSDFRQVEHNFRQLDRHVRERIATWEGSKGELLGGILGERDAIADSDQGASFRAFWDFLMSPQRQEEFTARLQHVMALPAMQSLKLDRRTGKILYDWLEAGEYTQRTVARLSQQLRRFLDDRAWLENRRIMDILQGIESKTLALREPLFSSAFPSLETSLPPTAAAIELPMERPLFRPPIKPNITEVVLEQGDESLDSSALYGQIVVDKAALSLHIRQSLQQQPQVSLHELCRRRPLSQGLAELVAYLELGDSDASTFTMLIDERAEDIIQWKSEARARLVRMPRVIYLRH